MYIDEHLVTYTLSYFYPASTSFTFSVGLGHVSLSE
jgi:hypothetical protein